MKKRTILLFSILPFLIGFCIAYVQGKPISTAASFNTNTIQSTDSIILSSSGDVYTLTQNGVSQVTHNQKFIEPVFVGKNIIAVDKTTNYASLNLFDQQGNKIKTLFNGSSNSIDTMSWITDPAVNPAQDRIAYVSDKDRAQTNAPDNALYILNLSSGKSTNIAKPDPYSGGLAHPLFDPVDGNIVLYDYYQYDPQTLTPYSTIEQYDNSFSVITTLTYENKNAYQAAFSQDGKQLLFLGRNDNFNTVTLYIADFDSTTGLSNIHALALGDFAYPEFSMTKGHIYFLQAQGNTGYNLMTATIKNSKLTNIQTVISGSSLLGNSSYEVTKVSQFSANQ